MRLLERGLRAVENSVARTLAKSVDLSSLDPQAKLDAIKAMGFTAFWDEHQPDCPYLADPGGYICNCIPPGTSWSAPRDVREFMGETYTQLARKRSHDPS